MQRRRSNRAKLLRLTGLRHDSASELQWVKSFSSYAIKESRSKLKGSIGSRLMNERKKEKRVLAIEEEHISRIANPDMVAFMMSDEDQRAVR